MKKLLHAVRWDFIRQFRYNIAGIMAVVTALYIGLLYALPLEDPAPLLLFLIFNDPVVLGMIFIGSLVLFEKSDGTLQALVVTPLENWKYLWSKAISLTSIALLASFAMAISVYAANFNWLVLFLAVALSSVLYIFLGIIVVWHCRSFNEYIIRLAIYFIPLSLPLLNFLQITDTYLWYLFPTQATLLLLEAAFAPVAAWKIIYAFVYLILCGSAAFYTALQMFKRG